VRVKIWRHLQRLGAVAVKQAVYALPNRDGSREDFEWVRAEVAASGGQATVFQAATVDDVSNDELREAFRRLRQEDYRAVVRSVGKIVRAAVRPRSRDPRALAKELRTWRDRLSEIEGLDYFGAPGREDARSSIAKLDELASAHRHTDSLREAERPLDPAAFEGRRWLTRPRPGIDRLASAWLIRRFIDRQARFHFGAPDAPREADVVTFDMFGGDFTHEGDRCTFEVLCVRFGLADGRLREIGEIVHDLDLKDARFGRVEAPIVGALVEGLRQLYEQDGELIERGVVLFEALYRGRDASTPLTKKLDRRTATGSGRTRRV
jgi:hypothetical protein